MIFRILLALAAVAACSQSYHAVAGGGASSRTTRWTTSRLQGTPDPPLPYVTERVYSEIRFQQPTAVRTLPGTDWILAAETNGTIRAFRGAAASTMQVVLDLRDRPLGQYGILDFTFHPQYPAEPWCYVSYSVTPQSDTGLRVARFRVVADEPPRLDASSELPILCWPNTGHFGSCIRFGPDGYLYAVTGDGAGPNPPDALNTGQDNSDLLSAMLRVDVSQSSPNQPYRIPADNPFVGMQGAREEIWAYGFRNPWKFCFEPRTGALWVADVGWDTFELIYRVERGGNYGWSIQEGSQSVRSDLSPGPTPILPPTLEHSHLEARSITGGEFYYGTRLPELRGAQIYGDWMTGKIWGLRHDGERVTFHRELADTRLQIICFFVDPRGDVCIVGYDGTIHRLVPNPVSRQHDFPRMLSETGLFASITTGEPAPGVYRYAVAAEPWMDGATAERLIAVPGNKQLSIFSESNWEIGQVKGYVSFPPDSVLAKTVSLAIDPDDPAKSRRVETQLLHLNGDAWQAYNYIWNEQQSEAYLAENETSQQVFMIRDRQAPGGVRRQTWHHASRNECLMCHVWSGGAVLGFKLHQLDATRRDDDETGSISQLDQLRGLGLFAEQPFDKPSGQVSPSDAEETLEDRARAYLHVNCSHCHRSEGGGLANFDARQTNSLQASRLIDGAILQGNFGLVEAGLIKPGKPHRSVLLYRMSKLGRGRMPHLGSQVVDVEGLELVRRWIRSLANRLPSEADREPDSVEQAVAALNALQATAESERQSKIANLLASPSGALALLNAVDEGTFDASLEADVIRIGTEHADSRARDLFERFLPEPQRIRRLGTSFELAMLAGQRGDIEAGRRLFLESNELACRNCHALQSTGKSVGPDLREAVRRYDRRQLLEQIVEPSKVIDQRFQTHQIATVAGKVVGGLLASESSESITIRDAAGTDTTIPRDEIDFMTRDTKSLMPEQLIRDLTRQQAADLLEFLMSLRAESEKTAD